MTFKEEIQTLKETHESPLLQNVQKVIRKAASNGESTITLSNSLYDKWVINWLKAQGFDVKVTYDQREGDFIRVSW